jgi:nitrite reductase/ring-hydroxylating ferredoxin subunit
MPVSSRSLNERFDFPPFPNCWLQIGWSNQLRRGQVKRITVCGRELVLFRGNDGRAAVLDAHCPHLGAHLGVGGTVEDNCVRCPFHGWQFNGDGNCTKIPYTAKIPAKARTRAWPVREVNGLIMMWHDAEGREPWFDVPVVPEFGSAQWTKPHFSTHTIKTRWREIVENGVDRTHFHALHRYPRVPDLDFRTDGHRFIMNSRVPWRRFGRDMTVELDIDAHGPGLAVTRAIGDLPFMVIGCPLPIDAETTVHQMTFIVANKLPFPLSELAVRFVRWIAMREFARDVPIWENKVTLPHPVLAEGDGPIMKFRNWSRQFYASDESMPRMNIVK